MSNAIIKLGTDKFNKCLNQCPVEHHFTDEEKKYATRGFPFVVGFENNEKLKWNNEFDKWLNQCPIESDFSNMEKENAYKNGDCIIIFDEVSIESLTTQNKALKELLSYIQQQTEKFVGGEQNSTLKEFLKKISCACDFQSDGTIFREVVKELDAREEL